MDTKEEQLLRAYDEHADAVYRYIFYRVFQQRHQAEDLLQECFLRTWQYLLAGHRIDNIRAFLFRTARNLIIDESRKKKPLPLEELIEAGGGEPSVHELAAIETSLDARTVLERLQEIDESFQEVILLRYVEELTPKEIAAILNESPNVISVRISRGIKKLREIISDEE